MDDVSSIIGKVVLSVGGGGAVIIAFSSYISKLWAQWFMQKEREKHSKEMEEYKHELQKEIDKARSIIEKSIYINKMALDGTYKYYEEIVPRMVKASDSIKQYIIVRNGLKNESDFSEQKVQKDYETAFHEVFEFYDYLNKYAIFISKQCYIVLMNFFCFCNDILKLKSENTGDVDWMELLSECVSKETKTIDVLRDSLRE